MRTEELVRCLSSMVVIGIAVLVWFFSEPRQAEASHAAAVPPPFAVFHEFYGTGGYNDPQARLNFLQGMMNGLTVWPPVEPGAANVLDGTGGLILRLPGSPGPAGQSVEDIVKHVSAFSTLSPLMSGVGLFWNLMPEWDQSGGLWVPRGRPTYSGLSREAAYRRFLQYYSTTHPALMQFLGRPLIDGPPYRLAAITDYNANVFSAYELGVELQLLERGVDELGDLSTGIAYLRGAARQHGKPWGIDISTWRSGNNGATRYDGNGRLRSGWSASYLERIYYLAFAAGAQIIHNEAATYRYPNGEVNPFGEVTRQFAEFALRRHPDVGQPTVPIAILTDHFSGFDTKHGVHNQASAVWYQDISYSSGDHMTDNFLKAAYPGHWLHGLTPGAPFADSSGVPAPDAFAEFLAQGGDPRAYEPMPTTRWGDNLDVLTTRTGAEGLGSYKVIVMVGDVSLNASLRNALTSWVARGGVLVMNAAQSTPADEELLGVQVTSRSPRPGSRSRWTSGQQWQPEPAFSYLTLSPVNAEVLAMADAGDPLITRRVLGEGQVILTAPVYLQSNARDRLLEIGVQLLDILVGRFEPVKVVGPAIEYVIGRPPGKVVITLANHRGTSWEGLLRVPSHDGPVRVVEYLSDQEQEFSSSGSWTTVTARVPPYGVRVVVVEHLEQGTEQAIDRASARGRQRLPL